MSRLRNGEAMRAQVKRRVTVGLTLILASSVLVLGGSTASAASFGIELCAKTATVTLPGAASPVPIWGFGVPTTPGDCSTATASLPGPVLEVNAGDIVTVTLGNALPGGHAPSFELPGLDVTGPTGGPYVFMASREGTFVYQSAGDAGRQTAMGLYGALVVRASGADPSHVRPACRTGVGTAFGSTFDRDCVLVLSAVDDAFNGVGQPGGYDPANDFDLMGYRATHWLINGTQYPDTPSIAAPAGTRLLLRYVNAGYDNTSMSLLGMHERVLARDAWPLTNPLLASSETIPAGGTEDALATVPATSPPSPNGFPLFNRQLHVTNAACAAGQPCSAGGMTTFIQP
jgi:FtsP/CotA-like multicopper oxidase with cupredoxin domain